MTDGDSMRAEGNVLVHMSKTEKTKVVGNVGMIIYDVTANKISVKVAAAALIGSWELVTSVADS